MESSHVPSGQSGAGGQTAGRDGGRDKLKWVLCQCVIF